MASNPLRTATPSLRSVYLVAASALPSPDLLTRLRAALVVHCGEDAVFSADAIESATVKELGAADAVSATSERRLRAIDEAEMVVADLSGADASVGAEVMYALHRRRCPVLCLWQSGAGGSFATGLPSHPPLPSHHRHPPTRRHTEGTHRTARGQRDAPHAPCAGPR